MHIITHNQCQSMSRNPLLDLLCVHLMDGYDLCSESNGGKEACGSYASVGERWSCGAA